MKKFFTTKRIAIIAIFIALTTAMTTVVKVPTIATEGYVNVGDAIVMFCGVFFGPIEGFLIGGIGSCLADLISGYAHWILPTFIIKGIEGLIISVLFLLLKKIKLNRYISATISVIIGGGLMVTGYFFAGWIMKGSAEVAATSVPANCMGWLFSVILAVLLLTAVDKTEIMKRINVKNNFSCCDKIDKKEKRKSANEGEGDKQE